MSGYSGTVRARTAEPSGSAAMCAFQYNPPLLSVTTVGYDKRLSGRRPTLGDPHTWWNTMSVAMIARYRAEFTLDGTCAAGPVVYALPWIKVRFPRR